MFNDRESSLKQLLKEKHESYKMETKTEKQYALETRELVMGAKYHPHKLPIHFPGPKH